MHSVVCIYEAINLSEMHTRSAFSFETHKSPESLGGGRPYIVL